MHVTLNAVTAEEYSVIVNRSIDYEEAEPMYFAKGISKVSMSETEADAIQCILTCEASYYLLRRSTGHCGSVTESMWEIRKHFINLYENKFAREYNDVNKNIDF